MKLFFTLLLSLSFSFCFAQKSGPVFKFVEETYDFGTVKQGQVVTHEFVFTNVGREPLVINNCTATCGCTVPEWPKQPINPGQRGVIKVSFNSSGKSGPQNKPVYIESNAVIEGKQKYEIYLRGSVEAPVPAIPASTNR